MIIPTFSELYTSILSDMRNRLGILSLIGKVKIIAYSAVQAGKLKIYYLSLSQTYKNIFYDQCDDETIIRYGRVILKRDLYPATAAEYKLTVTGEVGAVIAAGTTFKSRDTSTSPGQIFILDTLFTFTTTSGIIDVRALEVGIVSQLVVGDELRSTQPLADIDSLATVLSITTDPIDSETVSEYREKVILAAQLEPQGGARVDFRLWGSDAQGVRAVYPYTKDGYPSEIELYVEAFPTTLTPNGVPTATILAEVESVIELDPDDTLPIEDRGRRPMWAVLSVSDGNIKSIITLPVDVEITGLSDVSLLTSISDAIESFLYDIRPYMDGAENPNNSQNGKLYVADIVNVIRDTIGSATFSDVSVSVNSSVITSSYEFLDGKIPYINTVTNV